MSLWQRVKKLDTNSLSEITTVYSYNRIPVELRDLCAVWIESSVKYLQPDAFVSGLYTQIQERLASQEENDFFIPFYIRHKLHEFQNYILPLIQGGISGSENAQDLQKRFISCLESERLILKRAEDGNSPRPSLTTSEFTASLGFMQNSNPDRLASSSSIPSLHPPPPSYHLNQGQGLNRSTSSKQMEDAMKCYSPSEFLNNAIRIIIDSEMHKIFEVVWSLEESNNIFAFKCHDMKRKQDLRDQQIFLTQSNGTQQPQNIAEFQELEKQIAGIRHEILQMATLLYGNTCEVQNRASTVLQNWAQLKSELDLDLISWTHMQRHLANGKNTKLDISKLQHISEYLIEVAWKLRNLIKATDKIRQASINIVPNNLATNGSAHDLSAQLIKITQFIKSIVQDTFIVVNQPCQVLRNNTRLHVPPGKNDLEVGLLVGEKLGLQVTPPTVCVSIIDQKTCKDIEAHGLDGDKFKRVQKKGKLLPESTRLDYSPETKRTSAIFRQISLKEYLRNGRKSTLGKEQTECVTEEKLCILFRSEFTVGDINFQIWRTSLPIVITTHVSQDCLAWAVITWDNAFAQTNRIPFHVTDHSSWNSISEMLNYKFESMVGSPLTPENLSYLADRLSKNPGFPDKLSYAELCKFDLPEHKFTFWEWFFEAAKLIEQHLKVAWNGGYIMGFVDKEKAKNMLCNSGCRPGTFLFRLSDTVPGGISIVWLHSDGKAYSLNPFKGKDLLNQPFAEKLDQETLHFVYPDVPKEKAFKKYFDDYKSASKASESSNVDNGYVKVKNQLIIDNPNIPKFCLMDINTRSRSGNYEIITPQVPHQIDSPAASQVPQSPCSSDAQKSENLIEIDIDKIVGALTAPDYFDLDCVASPDTTSGQTSSERFMSRESSRRGSEFSLYSEESFYLQL